MKLSIGKSCIGLLTELSVCTAAAMGKRVHYHHAIEAGGINTKTKTKLHGLSLRANYTDRATAACRRSDC
jgi:hypothetical protein